MTDNKDLIEQRITTLVLSTWELLTPEYAAKIAKVIANDPELLSLATPKAELVDMDDPFIKKHLDNIWKLTKDAQIDRFIKPMFRTVMASSIEYFLQTGTVNGSFYEALNKMMDALRNWSSSKAEPVGIYVIGRLDESGNIDLYEEWDEDDAGFPRCKMTWEDGKANERLLLVREKYGQNDYKIYWLNESTNSNALQEEYFNYEDNQITNQKHIIENLQATIKQKDEDIERWKGISDGKNLVIKQLEQQIASMRGALSQLIFLNCCEMEGLASGQPTPDQWYEAFEKASDLLYNQYPKQ